MGPSPEISPLASLVGAARTSLYIYIYMLTQLAMPPFEVFCDCKGTVQTLLQGPGSGTGPDCTRAHMWAPFLGHVLQGRFRGPQGQGPLQYA